MGWHSITIRASGHSAMALCEALLELGAASVFIEEDTCFPGNRPVFAEPGEPALWEQNKVNALVSEDTDIDQMVRRASSLMEAQAIFDYSVAVLDEQDWVRLTQSQFQPMQILPTMWVVPSWHEPVDREALNLVIDPGPAFGTGGHASTRLCLKWLAEHAKGGEYVVDYGCGSGILSIGAKLLGAAEVMGVDIDPLALQASRDNAKRNQVQAQFYLPQHAPCHSADIVIANILANPLKLLAPVLVNLVASGGQLVLSGILVEQAGEMLKVYEPWLGMRVADHDEGWVSLVGTKGRTV